MNGKVLVIWAAIVALAAFCILAVAAFVAVRSLADEAPQASATSAVSGSTDTGGGSNAQAGADDDVVEANSLLGSSGIDRAEAEDAALGAVSGKVMESSLDDDFGRAVYKVEVLDRDGRLHEVYVDAANGDILRRETEDQEDSAEARSVSERVSMDRNAAEDAALKEVPGDILGTSLEDEDGRAIYEVEILGDDGDLHELYVDAESGQLIGHETEARDGSEYGEGFDH